MQGMRGKGWRKGEGGDERKNERKDREEGKGVNGGEESGRVE